MITRKLSIFILYRYNLIILEEIIGNKKVIE